MKRRAVDFIVVWREESMYVSSRSIILDSYSLKTMQLRLLGTPWAPLTQGSRLEVTC